MSLPKGGKSMLGVKSLFGIALLVFALRYARDIVPWLNRCSSRYAIGGWLCHLPRRGTRPRRATLSVGRPGHPCEDQESPRNRRNGTWSVSTLERLRTATRLACVGALRGSSGGPCAHREPAPAYRLYCNVVPGLPRARQRDVCGARVTQIALTRKFIALQVDATSLEDPEVDRLRDKYHVVGLPTVVVIDAKGAEHTRFTAFVGPEAFLAALNATK